MTMHPNDDDLVLHYYGELAGAEEARTTSHLASCAACQRNYTRLQRVLAAVDAAPQLEAPDGFERIAWARLEPALPGRRGGWLSWFTVAPARLAWASGVAALVIAAFVAGRWLPSHPAPSATTAAASNGQVRERILLVDLGDHLDLSQMVLVELISAEGDGSVDISSEQARAQQLVAANRLYRETASATGDAAIASLLDELERTLVDIAAGPSTLTPAALRDIQQRIESRGLLFKVRIVSSRVHQRQTTAFKNAQS
jgi:hypothetical protein